MTGALTIPGRYSYAGSAMGGRLGIHLTPGAPADRIGGLDPERDAARVAGRVSAWASLLTRFDSASRLSNLNADPREVVAVGPTLGSVLEWGAEAGRMSGGIVDVGMLDARLAAEHGPRHTAPVATEPARPGRAPQPTWSVAREAGAWTVARPAGLRFDLDGVAKGWIADRALALLWPYAGAIVDADGDLAIRVAPGGTSEIGIADPTTPGLDVAVLRLRGESSVPALFGVATSGVSVHRWRSAAGSADTHHLIDPRTGAPADTDIVQATVVSSTAREAEALAKAAVILGSVAGLDLLDRAGALGAVILTVDGQRFALPRTLGLLA